MTHDDRSATIRRLYYVEHWKIGTIAAQLGVHHDVVDCALGRDRARPVAAARAWEVDDYLPFVREQLKKYPKLNATRLQQMIRDRGYRGGVAQLRRAIVLHQLRPVHTPEAFATRVPLPAEEAQVDWATIGKLRVGRFERPLYALVVILPYSRDCFVGFYHDMKVPTLIEAHIDAFTLLGGVPRRMVYDNMKTAVIERVGDAVRFHPSLLALADHYGFEPVACRPRRPNEKGSVERRVRDLRGSMLAGTDYVVRDQFTDAFRRWRLEVLHARPHDRSAEMTVGEAVAREREHLRSLPREPFAAFPLLAARIGKQAWVTVDTNRYSVPPAYVGKTVSILVTHDRICVLDNQTVVCTHMRSWQRHGDHQLDEHVRQFRQLRARNREHAGRARLLAHCPAAASLLQRLIDEGELTANHTRGLNELVDQHGANAVNAAIIEATERGTPRVASVRMLLMRRLENQSKKPALLVPVPEHIATRDTPFITHNLGDYDVCTIATRRRSH